MRFFENIRVNLIYWWNNSGKSALGDLLEGVCTFLLPVFFILCIPLFIIEDIEESDRNWCRAHGYSEELSHKEIKALKRELERQEKEIIRQRLNERGKNNLTK